jgi:uncharacterized damage-inducible protein DinB
MSEPCHGLILPGGVIFDRDGSERPIQGARGDAMSSSLLSDALGHHVWATLRLIDVCLPLSREQLDATAAGTYGSILATMRHVVGSDASYLFVLTEGRVAEIEEDSLDLPELRAVMEANGQAWASLLAENPDPEVDVARHRDDGADSIAPMGIRLAQAIHHGTDHRSQVCTTLTTLGIEPPEIDAWDYAEQAGRLRVTESAAT